MLTILVLTPIIGAFLIGIIKVDNTEKFFIYGIVVSIITFIISVVVWLSFDNSFLYYQINSTIFAIDGIALPFIIITTFLTPIAILASWYNVTKIHKSFIIGQLIIEAILLAVFLVTDAINFYIFFEAALVPLFVTVGAWGTSQTRVRSALLLFLFTLIGSLIILLSIVLISSKIGTTDFASIRSIDITTQHYVWIGFFIAFAVKTPIVPFHIWLPRAHADGPIAASIILAGTVLKIATYGYLRICIILMPEATEYYSPLAQTIAIVSLIYASLATIRQSDLKALVAYSSVGHIAIVVLGLFSGTTLGIEGAILLSIAHAFVSPALFILVGGVLYDRFHTRSIIYYRGIGLMIPLFATLFFIATACNIGVPGTANWLGEFITLAGIFEHSFFLCVIASSGIVLSSLYSIWVFTRVVGGSYSPYLTWTNDITRRETIVLLSLLIPAIVFGIYGQPIVGPLHMVISTLVS